MTQLSCAFDFDSVKRKSGWADVPKSESKAGDRFDSLVCLKRIYGGTLPSVEDFS